MKAPFVERFVGLEKITPHCNAHCLQTFTFLLAKTTPVHAKYFI